MRTASLLALVIAIAACSVDAKPDSTTKPKQKSMSLDLTWKMTRDGDRLKIDYKLANNTKARVLVIEQLLVKDVPESTVVVRNDKQPKTVAFTLALVETDEKVLHQPMPVARSLDAGATASGTVVTAWPLRMWHNYSRLPALAPDLTNAVFEIGYIDEPDPKLEDMTVAGDKIVKTPVMMVKQKLLRGDVQPLPR